MEDLIKALNILWLCLNEYNSKWPTSCDHDVLYVCGVDMNKLTLENIHELAKLGFIPGSDDDAYYICIYNENGEYEGDVDFENISQEELDNIKDNITNCFHSYRFGSC